MNAPSGASTRDTTSSAGTAATRRAVPLRMASTSTGCWPATAPPPRCRKAGSSSSVDRVASPSPTRSRVLARAAGALLALCAAGVAAAQGSAPPGRATLNLAVLRAEDDRRPADSLLHRALTEADPALRARAALACGRLQDSSLVPALIPLLRDPASEVRQEAAFALGQIGHRSARTA